MLKQTILTGFVLTCAALSAADGAEPVCRWTFDSIDNNLVASAAGAVTGKVLPKGEYELIDGVSGKALHFGAKTGGVMLPKLPVDLTKSFTVVAMVKLDKEAAEPKNYRKFKDIWGNCGTRGPGARLTVFYGGIQFNSGDGEKSDSFMTGQATYKLPLEQYFQIAVTYDGAQAVIYADGKKLASKEMKVTAGKQPLCVGSCGGSAYGFMGAVDDLAIYDRALSAEEVAKLALDQSK